MNWHKVAELWMALLWGSVVLMSLMNPFFENRRLLKWTFVVLVPTLALTTVVVGGGV